MPSDFEETLTAAVTVLRQGGIVAYPAETLFGLGVDPFQEAAVQRLQQLKGRPAAKSGLILLLPDWAFLPMVACEPSPLAWRLMRQFWPGPLTLVLSAQPTLPNWLVGPDRTVAVRIPAAPVAMALLSAWGGPLISTSANRSGLPPARCVEDVRRLWPSQLYIVPDQGTLFDSGGSPSTLVDLHTDRALLLRAGAIPAAWLRQWLPDLFEV
ncbi:MAG: threonylcarbamoyl-AMP synthase [Magnetococcales bacterium]|nr:threonylcarbamoyl-AMP synthase [Magnetococcales bacterium]